MELKKVMDLIENEKFIINCEVAVTETNRRFIGIELDKNYLKIAKERVERACMEVA